jgi:hypothetical protein
MKVSKLILATAIIVAACQLGCITAPSVNGRYSFLSSTDFSKFKSFRVDVSEGAFSTPESGAHFREAMTRALSAKGLSEDPENPDFTVFVAPTETYVEEYWYAGNIQLPRAVVRVNFAPASGGLNIYEAVANSYFEPGMSQEHKNLILDETVRVILMQFPPGE